MGQDNGETWNSRAGKSMVELDSIIYISDYSKRLKYRHKDT